MIGKKPITYIHNGTGGMDKDTDPDLSLVDGSPAFDINDYKHALNMRPLSASQGESFGNEVILGNGVRVAQIGYVDPQTETLRIDLIEYSDPCFLSFTLYENGINVYQNVSLGYVGGVTYLDIENFVFTDCLDTYSPGTYTVTLNGYYLEISETTGSNFTFTIILTLTNSDSEIVYNYHSYMTTEPITTDQEGYLIPITSVDITGDLFIISTVDTSLSDPTYSKGVTEIGVFTYDGNNYTYIRLLRTVTLTTGKRYLPDLVGERVGSYIHLYWVDGNNKDKYFYYKGDYIQDGAIITVNSDNIYYYGECDLQMLQQKFPNSGIFIELTGQITSGGGLKAGMYRYAIILLDTTLKPTNSTPIGLPFPVSSDYWWGSLDGGATTKKNQITVSNINPDIFPYMKLVVVHYTDTAVSIYSLPKIKTGYNPIIIEHTGNESIESLTSAEISLLDIEIFNSKNNIINTTRYFKSNITMRPDDNLQSAFDELSCGTYIEELPMEDAYMTELALNEEGNYNPVNAANALGYMDNETYRIAGRIKYINGGYSKVFFIEDYMIDPSGSGDVSLCTAYNTTTDQGSLRVRKISISGWANFWTILDTIIEVETVEKVEIMRCDCINEVLATGLSMGMAEWATGGKSYYSPFSYVSGGTYDLDTPRTLDYCYMISPDIMLRGITEMRYIDGDYINYSDQFTAIGANTYSINSGGESVKGDQLPNIFPTSNLLPVLIQYTGNGLGASYSQATPDTLTYLNRINNTYYFSTTYSPDNTTDLYYLDANKYALPIAMCQYVSGSNNWYYYNPLLGNGLMFTFSTPPTGKTFGKYFQYVRPITNKYGEFENNVFYWTGAEQIQNVSNDVIVGNGDTYITKTGFKVSTTKDNTDNHNGNMIISFFSQNRALTTYRNYGSWPGVLKGINRGFNDGVIFFAFQDTNQEMTIAKQYVPRQQEQLYAPFDISFVNDGSYHTRIIYSLSKPLASLVDYYLVFQPLNYRDLDYSLGEISGMVNFNGEMVTFQRSRFERQYVNNDGILTTNDNYETIIGTGSVLSRRGLPISNYGTSFKWGIKKGMSRGGDDILLWWCELYGVIMRMGSDGVQPISDISKINRDVQEVNSLLRYTDSMMTDTILSHPTTYEYALWGTPIRMGYDAYNKEILITVHAFKKYNEWRNDVPYDSGDIVMYGTKDFDGIPVFYQADISISPGGAPPDENLDWGIAENVQIAITLVYSILKNRFTALYHYRPKLYMEWNNTIVTASPVYNEWIVGSPKIWPGDLYVNDNSSNAACFYETDTYNLLIVNVGVYFIRDNTDTKKLNYSNISNFLQYSDWFTYIIVINNTDYIVKEINANDVIMYEDIPMGTYDPIIKVCWGEEPYIQFMDNLYPFAQKRPQAIQIFSEQEPIMMINETPTQNTFSTYRNTNNSNLSDFQQKGREYRTGIRNNLSGGNNNTIFSDRLRSEWWTTTIKFRKGIVSRIRQIVSLFGVVNRNI